MSVLTRQMLAAAAGRAIAPAGGVITESFDQPDSTTLGPDLTWTEVNGDWSTETSRVTVGAAGGDNYRSARAETPLSSDMYAQIDIVGLVSPGLNRQALGVAVRFAPAAQTYYGGVFESVSGLFEIYRVSSGSVTSLATVAGTLPSVLRAEVQGSDLRLLADGVEVLTATDSAIATGDRAGLAASRRSSNRALIGDNFEAGSL